MSAKRQEEFALSMPFEEALERYSRVSSVELVEPESPEKKPAPFIKWAGGKRQLLPELTSRLPSNFNRYFEPFLGGGALFFEVCERIKSASLSDTTFELIIAYNVIEKDPEKLMALLQEHARHHNSEYYYRIREQHDLQDAVKIAARFIYLNKTCYNGLYRVNKKGHFNVPIGRYAAPSVYGKDNILACHNALKVAHIEYRDFETVSPEAGDFVYCDPPYHPVSQTASFTGYTKTDFAEVDQIRLRDFALRLHKKGVFVMLSNSDTQFTRKLYDDPCFKVDVVQATRFVNCKPAKRGLINELVITSY